MKLRRGGTFLSSPVPEINQVPVGSPARWPQSWESGSPPSQKAAMDMIDRSGLDLKAKVKASEDLFAESLGAETQPLQPSKAVVTSDGASALSTTAPTHYRGEWSAEDGSTDSDGERCTLRDNLPRSDDPYSDSAPISEEKQDDKNIVGPRGVNEDEDGQGMPLSGTDPFEDENQLYKNLVGTWGVDFDKDGQGMPPKRSPNLTKEDMIDAFSKVVQSGKVPAQSYVGNWWSRQIKDHPELKIEYDAQPNMKEKKKFKFSKVQEKLKDLEETFEETHGEVGEDKVSGKHECFTNIWRAEGKDDAGLQAARAYCETVTKLHKQGNLGPRRAPWIKWNNFTKRFEYLYVKAQYLQSFLDGKKYTKTYKASRGAEPASAAAKPNAAKPRHPSDGKDNRRKAIADAPKAAKGKPAPAQAGKAAKDKAGSKTASIKTVKDTKTLHLKMKSTMASASDILSEILSREEWKKLRSLVTPATEARAEIETWRQRSAFWRQWTVATDVTKLNVASFSDQEIAKELKRAGELEILIDRLYAEITDIQDHQAIMKKRKVNE